MMKHKSLLIGCIIALLSSSLVFGFQIELPDEAEAYNDLEVRVLAEDGDPTAESVRFYIMEEGEQTPLFLELTKRNGFWSETLPGEYVKGEKLVFFAEVMSDEGVVHFIPGMGKTLETQILQDNEPPEIEFVLPAEGSMVIGQRQSVLFRVTDNSSTAEAEITMGGDTFTSVDIAGKFIKALYTPGTAGDFDLDISVTDAAGNVGEAVFPISVGEKKEPFFTVAANYDASLDIAFTVSSEQESLDFPGDLFSGLGQDIEADFSLSGDAVLQAGPAMLTAVGVLSDSDALYDSNTEEFGYFENYPSSLLSDLYDLMRLWDPWNFDHMFLYEDADVREYENSNEFSLEFSLFSDIFIYRFGDQTIHFQDQTVKDLYFRGSSLQLDIPLFSLSIGQGLTDPGLAGEAWPRGFVGVNFGLDVFDYWWFNTNISFISDIQGPYSQITDDGFSSVGDLYGLYDEGSDDYTVNPQENMIFGLGTGINTKWFEIKTEVSLTLYASDAGDVDLESIGDTVSGFVDDFDITEYTDYLDTIQGYFPVFNYFPLSTGLAAYPWGISYGADLIIPDLGFSAWLRKTDASYKSFGASVSTGVMEYGGLLDLEIGEWDFGFGYGREEDNIGDIILNDILPLVSNFAEIPSIVESVLTAITEEDSETISDITHEASMDVGFPGLGEFGRMNGGYGFTWEKTNAEDLDLADSEDNNEAMIHTAELSWKSKNYKFNDFSFGIGLETEDSFTMNRIVEGVEDSSTSWDFGVKGSGKLGYQNFSFSSSYEREWGSASDSEIEQTVKGGVKLKKLWFDSIGLTGSWEDVYDHDGSQTERSIGSKLSLKKGLGIFETGMDFSVDMTNSFTDDTDDESSWELEIWGGISL